jgi:hypothetical protein
MPIPINLEPKLKNWTKKKGEEVAAEDGKNVYSRSW